MALLALVSLTQKLLQGFLGEVVLLDLILLLSEASLVIYEYVRLRTSVLL